MAVRQQSRGVRSLRSIERRDLDCHAGSSLLRLARTDAARQAPLKVPEQLTTAPLLVLN